MTDSANGHLDTVRDTLGLYGPLAKLNGPVMSWINTNQLFIRESNEDLTRLENDLYILGHGMIRSSSASSILESTSVNTTMHEFMEAVEDAFQEELDEQNSVEQLDNGIAAEDIAKVVGKVIEEKAKRAVNDFKKEGMKITSENVDEFEKSLNDIMGDYVQFIEIDSIDVEDDGITIKGHIRFAGNEFVAKI